MIHDGTNEWVLVKSDIPFSIELDYSLRCNDQICAIILVPLVNTLIAPLAPDIERETLTGSVFRKSE
jgi:hypothetical protein